MEVVFVLVEPAVPENIGAAARSLKTMGFTKLRLVKPTDHLADEARWLAHGSNDVLESAFVYDTFSNAISDLDFIIGTTAKKRSAKEDYYTPEEAKEIVNKKSDTVSSIGIVFGREESGLTNQEVKKCDIVSSIPLNNPYPSINLAQSIMIYAYIFSDLKKDDLPEAADNFGDTRLYSELRSAATNIFDQLELMNNENLYHRMMERIASVSSDDARLLLSFAKKFRQKFDKN